MGRVLQSMTGTIAKHAKAPAKEGRFRAKTAQAMVISGMKYGH